MWRCSCDFFSRLSANQSVFVWCAAATKDLIYKEARVSETFIIWLICCSLSCPCINPPSIFVGSLSVTLPERLQTLFFGGILSEDHFPAGVSRLPVLPQCYNSSKNPPFPLSVMCMRDLWVSKRRNYPLIPYYLSVFRQVAFVFVIFVSFLTLQFPFYFFSPVKSEKSTFEDMLNPKIFVFILQCLEKQFLT